MNLPLFISGRYLFARKSHNVINIISAISAIGMAVGTAALVIILSVYNGFDTLIKSSLDKSSPDVVIAPSEGKVFMQSEAISNLLNSDSRIKEWTGVLQEQVFAMYSDSEGAVTLRGVPDGYRGYRLYEGGEPRCICSQGVARRLGVNPRFVSQLKLYYPDRKRTVSISNPLASLREEHIHPLASADLSGMGAEDIVLVPIEVAGRLLDYSAEVSFIEIRLDSALTPRGRDSFIKEASEVLGESFSVKDREKQNEMLYKVVRSEKAAIFLILFFVVIIVAFNIYGSLSMLIIEKKEDIETLRFLGAEPRTVDKIFRLEGWFISLLGLAAGLIIGIGFAWLQQKFSFIKMPGTGSYIVSSYPIVIKAGDILLTAVGVALTGYIIAAATRK